MKYLRVYEMTDDAISYVKKNEAKRKEFLQDTLKEYVRRSCGKSIDIIGNFDIGIGEYGKPYIADKDIEIGFSISHSGNYWGCIVGDEPVGLDIQVVEDRCGISAIAERFFSESENDYLKREDERGFGLEAFYDIWVRKEAYIKLTGRGIGQGLSSFSVADINGLYKSVNNKGRFFFTDLVELGAFDEDYSMYGVKGAVCCESDEEIIIKSVIFDAIGE
ncbi:MAG: 4'-phosphopantetheinyl transferase superfamily protein [Clostridiales bacterium]|nr:4'-phosphopantetheinyl transferase superfamily protein [Clostridiales bacterium]